MKKNLLHSKLTILFQRVTIYFNSGYLKMVMLFRRVHMDKQGYIGIDHTLQSRQVLTYPPTALLNSLLKFQSPLVKIQAAVTKNIALSESD